MLIKILFFEARFQRKHAFQKIDSLVFAVDVTNMFTGNFQHSIEIIFYNLSIIIQKMSTTSEHFSLDSSNR